MEATGFIHPSQYFAGVFKQFCSDGEYKFLQWLMDAMIFLWNMPHIWDISILLTFRLCKPILLTLCHKLEPPGSFQKQWCLNHIPKFSETLNSYLMATWSDERERTIVSPSLSFLLPISVMTGSLPTATMDSTIFYDSFEQIALLVNWTSLMQSLYCIYNQFN
jgi:hypothetical protein